VTGILIPKSTHPNADTVKKLGKESHNIDTAEQMDAKQILILRQ
jgi:hypothetical protein